jgi:hypothetical protein
MLKGEASRLAQRNAQRNGQAECREVSLAKQRRGAVGLSLGADATELLRLQRRCAEQATADTKLRRIWRNVKSKIARSSMAVPKRRDTDSDDAKDQFSRPTGLDATDKAGGQGGRGGLREAEEALALREGKDGDGKKD